MTHSRDKGKIPSETMCCNENQCCSFNGPISKTTATIARIVIGLLFIFSGLLKIGVFKGYGDPYAFASAVKAFHILHGDMILFTTFAIPWLEIICGSLLVIGFWTRAAAQVINLMLVIFIIAMITVIYRKLDVDCGCFGEYFGATVGYVSIIRNIVLIAITSIPVIVGPGYFAVSNICKTQPR